jgi:predicted methyltransferase
MTDELCCRGNSQDRWEQISVFHIGERIIGMNDKVKLPIGIENFEEIWWNWKRRALESPSR